MTQFGGLTVVRNDLCPLQYPIEVSLVESATIITTNVPKFSTFKTLDRPCLCAHKCARSHLDFDASVLLFAPRWQGPDLEVLLLCNDADTVIHSQLVAPLTLLMTSVV